MIRLRPLQTPVWLWESAMAGVAFVFSRSIGTCALSQRNAASRSLQSAPDRVVRHRSDLRFVFLFLAATARTFRAFARRTTRSLARSHLTRRAVWPLAGRTTRPVSPSTRTAWATSAHSMSPPAPAVTFRPRMTGTAHPERMPETVARPAGPTWTMLAVAVVLMNCVNQFLGRDCFRGIVAFREFLESGNRRRADSHHRAASAVAHRVVWIGNLLEKHLQPRIDNGIGLGRGPLLVAWWCFFLFLLFFLHFLLFVAFPPFLVELLVKLTLSKRRLIAFFLRRY